MRALAACLLGCLALGGLSTMAACSDSTDMGSAGTGGSSAVAGSGGKAGSAGSSSTAGTGGAAECSFRSIACSACLGDKCQAQAAACSKDDTCTEKFTDLPDCACDPANDADECLGKFVTDAGDVAEKLANCYSLNCEAACQ